MGLLDKFVHAMNIKDEDEDYGYDEGYDDDGYMDDEPDEPVRNEKRGFFSRNRKADIEEEEPKASKGKITPMRQSKRRADSSDREICMFKPVNSDESCDIMDALLSDRTVVLNLEGLHDDVAQKIIDTLSGACYALSGNMLKISNYIFIVAPKSVELSGDSQGNVLREAFELPLAAASGGRI
ncbi:MAG: cell division protein SepF [Lachnospiraceae bacterium]|nr:cell division protein SepF [Lachnospiraceae bacterium]